MEGSLAEEEEEEEEELRDLVSDSEGGLGSELCVSPTHTHTHSVVVITLSVCLSTDLEVCLHCKRSAHTQLGHFRTTIHGTN